jgi:nucleoside-diphosphate-sugar epimerase
MIILVVGATGATGKHLVEHLLNQGHDVKAIVRSPERIPESIRDHDKLTLITTELLDLDVAELQAHVKDCDAIASCLGHNITFKGMYGHPRRLVTDTAKRLCKAIKDNAPGKKVKYVLMNTTGNRNRDLKEPNPIGQRVVIGLLRLMLPPHVDNEKAADFLRTEIGQHDPQIEWTAVRPVNLVNESQVTKYDTSASPLRNPITDRSKVSRINVAHFMAELITNNNIWQKWKGQMPVIYNRENSGDA